jgi:hypothetical protein
MIDNLKKHLILIITIFLITSSSSSSEASSTNNEWHYKFTFTTNINSQLSVSCENSNDVIWIGWSHYGTRNANNPSFKLKSSEQAVNFPNEYDCWMNFTEKIAEQCNGAQQCDLSSQPTYIHKCGKISDYLYVSYRCIQETKIFDICKPIEKTFKLNSLNTFNNFYIKSTDFPTEYESSLDCSCSISSKHEQSLKLDVLWFSLQDNDYLNLFNKNLTGWINPTYEMPIMSKQTTIRFVTDDSLAYKGFWLKMSSRKACRDDWQLVGDICVKVFSDLMDWRAANHRCQQMNGYLIKIDDVVSDLKLTQYMKSFYPEVSSYWIGLRKFVDQYNQERWMWSNNSTNYNDVSWWPWRKVHNSTATNNNNDKIVSPNNCVVKKRNEDGYFAVTCDSAMRNSFICQTETINPISSSRDPVDTDIKLQCGTTDQIQKYLAEMLEFEKIGLASIKNYELKQKTATTSTPTPATTTSTIKSTSTTPITNKKLNDLIDESIEAEPLDVSFKVLTNDILSTIKPSNPRLKSSQSNNDNKLNTTVLAGIVCGIGFVIVLINLGILFICRRNLKKFLKNTKDSQHSSSNQPRDDMIQEYFDAFNTFQNLNKSTLPPVNKLLLQTGLSEQQKKALTLLHNKHLNTDDSLLIESAQLFYNPQIPVRQACVSTGSSSSTSSTSSTSAFKPFNRLDENNQTLNSKHHLIEQAFALSQQMKQNQYDKISHLNHQGHLNHNQFLKHNNNNNQNELNSSSGQYAHTYECLDNLEVPNRRNNTNLNNNKNYRTLNLNNNDSGVDTTMIMMMMNSLQSPTNTTTTNATLTNNLNDLNFNNVSTSSASSSSGTSLTQHLIKNNNNSQDFVTNHHHPHHLLNNHHFQQQQQQQIITLNDLKHLNHLILNNNNSNATVSLLNNKLNNLICNANGEILTSLDNNGTWSPDSAYYSSIPTLTNYSNNQQQHNHHHNHHHQQQFNNTNNLNESFKSHLV